MTTSPTSANLPASAAKATKPGQANHCELCFSPGGELLWNDAHCRVVRVTGPEAVAFPGYCRVIWTAHLAEMSDLSVNRARHLLEVVQGVERALRTLVKPDKINLASLGNVVPHLHWHVIPRWQDDSHFPSSIWAPAVRTGVVRSGPSTAELIRHLQAELPHSLPTLAP